MAKMEKKTLQESKYNPSRLRELCEKGIDAQKAKKELNLTSMQSLRQHLMRLSVEDNQLRTLPGLYTRSSSRVKLGKQGIKLSLKKLEAAGINLPENTEFRVEFDEDTEQILFIKVEIGSNEPNKVKE